MTIEELIHRARRGPAQEYPTQTYQSQPIPCRGTGGLAVAFMYGPQSARPGATSYGRPTDVVELDAESGAVRSARPWTGAAAAPGGYFSLPAGMSLETFEGLREEYYVAMNRLLWPYANSGASSPEVVAAARTIRRLAPVVLEGPLLPYYRAVGADFFGWVDRTAGG